MGGFLREVMDSGSPNSLYGYPTTAQVAQFQSDEGKFHIILGVDASPITNYANAPNGSIYICKVAVGPTAKVWMKTDADFGQSDGTWVSVSGIAAKRFYAKVTQSGTGAPALGTVHINELLTAGTNPTPARTGTGVYTFTLTGAFTVGKTYARITPQNAAARVPEIIYTDINVITVNFFDAATPSAADSGDFDLVIEVLN